MVIAGVIKISSARNFKYTSVDEIRVVTSQLNGWIFMKEEPFGLIKNRNGKK